MSYEVFQVLFDREHGSVATIRYGELGAERFNQLIRDMFDLGDAPLWRLWGNPQWLGPRKVHVYGCDRVTWTPVYFEIAESWMVIMLPNGGLASTVDRVAEALMLYLGYLPFGEAMVGNPKYEKYINLTATDQADGITNQHCEACGSIQRGRMNHFQGKVKVKSWKCFNCGTCNVSHDS